MGRPLRIDIAGAYYHIGNRGIARRTYLEVPKEYRYFKSRMAYAVRRGEIRVVAFALMNTHFHLLVQSLGALSTALRRIQNGYVRRFNITHHRDGPLGRGRFFSKRIDSLAYRRNVLLYQDDNPVVAKMADLPEHYEWGSAHLYALEHRPRWLDTEWVDSLDLGYGRQHGDTRLWTPEQRRWRASLVEARLEHPHADEDPLDTLRARVPGRVWAWMVRKAELADGTRPGIPLVGPLQVRDLLGAAARREEGAGIERPGCRGRTAIELATIGLLRDVSGQPWTVIAKHVSRHPSSVREAHRQHARLVTESPAYAEFVHRLIQTCLDALPI